MRLLILIIGGFILRIVGVNWDGGFHLHPDERMLLMVGDRLHLFDQMNPDFFNYGSLPLYLVKAISQFYGFVVQKNIATYSGMLVPGRILSGVFDLATMIVLYKVCMELFRNKRIAEAAVFFYGVAFFPIQNSHFFITDTFLTFFTTLMIWRILLYLRDPHFNSVFYVAIAFSFALATKFTAIIFLPFLTFLFLLRLDKNGRLKINTLKQSAAQISTFYLLSSLFFFLSMPYAVLEHQRFYTDIMNQIQMNSNAYAFPYTLQYVGSIPYLYHVKQIFLWGLGPIISTLSLVGIIFFVKKIPKLIHNNKTIEQFIFFFFYLFYFLIIGRSAVKFMRYMLPVYPFLAIMAGYAFYRMQKWIKFLVVFLALGWTFIFINIYSMQHTRLATTEWILKNISEGKTLAVEHWDDRLPLVGQEKYTTLELPLYDQPDNEEKWKSIEEKINRSDYIIIASNRLYTPLQKLADCEKFTACYPKTAQYYQSLFAGKLGFEMIKEFHVYPHLQIGSVSIEIPDDSADESFTVYDHPKIFIFKKDSF